jgi:hypothetical protein
VHRLDALIIASGEIIRQENVLGVIIRNGKQAVIFSLFGLFGFYLLGIYVSVKDPTYIKLSRRVRVFDLGMLIMGLCFVALSVYSLLLVS